MDDLISRQVAIDEWKNDFKGYVNALDLLRDDYKGIMAYIDELPSAQSEQKSGEWIYDGVKRICPFCKDFIVTGRSIVKYCWNCGARLKERSEDE